MKTIILAILTITILGCTTVPVAAAERALRGDLELLKEENLIGNNKQDIVDRDLQGKKVVAHVIVAGSDAGLCRNFGVEDNCDANFSLTAKLFADGTAQGQWQDTWKGDKTGQYHVAIDCLDFFPDKKSVIIGGAVTKSSESSCVGAYFIAFAKDGNPDEYSARYFGCDASFSTCSKDQESLFTKDEHFKGEVKITHSG